MSVRPSHQAGWCTSHCFWARSQQQGPRKVLVKGKASQGQTEERGEATADFCPGESAATARPLRAWGRLPPSRAHSTSFWRGRRAGGLIRPPAPIGKPAWVTLLPDYRSGILLRAIPGSGPAAILRQSLLIALRLISPFHQYSVALQDISQRGGSNTSVTPSTWGKASALNDQF